MSRFIRCWFDTGFYTGDDELVIDYPDETTDIEIENDVSTLFYEHCDDYSYLLMPDFEDDMSEEDYYEEYESRLEDCSYGWEEISEEEFLDLIDDEDDEDDLE